MNNSKRYLYILSKNIDILVEDLSIVSQLQFIVKRHSHDFETDHTATFSKICLF